MFEELESLSEEASDCLDIAAPIAGRAGMAVTSVAELICRLRRIKLPSAIDSMKLRAQASSAMAAMRAFISAGLELRKAELSAETFAAMLDMGGIESLTESHALWNKAWNHCGVRVFEETADPRVQLIANMMASAFDVWFDYHEEPLDFDFIDTEDGLDAKPGTALALAIETIGIVHDVDVEEISACLPAAKRAMDEDFLAIWDAEARTGARAVRTRPDLRLIH